jgi:multidrug resistance efflux pump
MTNLPAQPGDFVNAGGNTLSLVDARSYWIDGYLEDTGLGRIQIDDPAETRLMSSREVPRGHVDSIARAINVANAQPNGQGVTTANPIFTWVRLVPRIPVRVRLIRCNLVLLWRPG